MLFNKFIITASTALIFTAHACPYADPTKRDQPKFDRASLTKRVAQITNPNTNIDTGDNDPNPIMIGDLATIGATTSVGTSIQNILLGTEDGQSNVAGYRPPPSGSRACKADQCCMWGHVSNFLAFQFRGPSGRCNDRARAAIRLGFHDAAGWSKKLAAQGQDFGGADGSLVLSGTEILRGDNNGLQDIVQQMKFWQSLFGVGMADLIQFAAVHAVVTCPLGPRIRFFAGRKDSSQPAPDGLLPHATSDADTLINLFADKTISPHELAALVGAHTTSEQDFFLPSRRGAPQDSTPGVWDVSFYNETLLPPLPEVVHFPSDKVLAAHPSINDEWNKFRQGNGVGQDHWNEDYAKAYTRLSLLGVNNINQLTECSQVLPQAISSFPGASQRFKDHK